MITISRNSNLLSRDTIITVSAEEASQAGLFAQAIRAVLEENAARSGGVIKPNDLDTLHPGLTDATYDAPSDALLSTVRRAMSGVSENNLGYVVYNLTGATRPAHWDAAEGTQMAESPLKAEGGGEADSRSIDSASKVDTEQPTYRPHHHELRPHTTTGPLTAVHIAPSALSLTATGDIEWGTIPSACSSIMTSTPGPTVFILPDGIPNRQGGTATPEPTDLLAAIAETRDDARGFGEFVDTLTDAGV
jgi:hypothetical protein